MKTHIIEKPPEITGDLELAGAYMFADGGGTVYCFKSTITNEWYEFVWKSKKWIKCKISSARIIQNVGQKNEDDLLKEAKNTIRPVS